MASAISSTEVGSTSSAASPATSGREETDDVTIGSSRPIASRSGSPNPSFREGNANEDAAAYRPSRSDSDT